MKKQLTPLAEWIWLDISVVVTVQCSPARHSAIHFYSLRSLRECCWLVNKRIRHLCHGGRERHIRTCENDVQTAVERWWFAIKRHQRRLNCPAGGMLCVCTFFFLPFCCSFRRKVRFHERKKLRFVIRFVLLVIFIVRRPHRKITSSSSDDGKNKTTTGREGERKKPSTPDSVQP